MSVDKQTVVDLICDLVQPFNENGIELSKDTDLTADLSIDSVAIMDLLMTVEDTYDISIPINRLSDMRTISDLAKVVHETIEVS